VLYSHHKRAAKTSDGKAYLDRVVVAGHCSLYAGTRRRFGIMPSVGTHIERR
jgi:hypothetical protein